MRKHRKGGAVGFASNSAYSLFQFRLAPMKALVDSGIRTVCIAPPDARSEDLANSNLNVADWHLDAGSFNPWKEFRSFIQFAQLLRENEVDILFSYTIKCCIYAGLMSRFMPLQVVMVIPGLGSSYARGGMMWWFARTLYRIAISNKTQVWFLNSHDHGVFSAAGLIEDVQTRILPGEGVDTTQYSSDVAEPEGTVRFLFIARMIKEKGIREYVEAACRVRALGKDCEFLAVGPLDLNNPEALTESQLSSLLKGSGVKYLGAVKNVHSLIEACSCVVLPSYYREGLSRSLLEAASMQRPIITTDWPGCRETVIDGVSGFLCQPRNTSSLANQIIKIIEIGRLGREAMGIAGRQYVLKNFSMASVVTTYVNAVGEMGA